MGLAKNIVIVITICLFIVTVHANNPETTLNIMVGSFSKSGAGSKEMYGIAKSSSLLRKVTVMANLPDGYWSPKAPNQMVQVEYYGAKAPDYYSSLDKIEVETTSPGTPRYALIAAKFIKHRLKTTKATHVNLFAASFGGLITRYMIEKNLENLAASGKIVRWLTIEGAVCGAYPANFTKDPIMKAFLVLIMGLDITDPSTMHYKWLEENINNPRDATNCPYFKNILIGHHISSNDSLREKMISLLSGKPNDGTLLTTDMELKVIPKEYRFRGRMPMTITTNTTHKDATKNSGVIANVATFFRSNRRVTIRVTKGTVHSFTEFSGPAEIVFQGQVSSPYAYNAWWTDKEVSQLGRENHTPPVVQYKWGQKRELNITLFDWLVNPEEKKLRVKLSAEEIDWDEMYKIKENILNPYEDLGSAEIDVDVTTVGKKVYQVKTDNWEASLEVEVYDYK